MAVLKSEKFLAKNNVVKDWPACKMFRMHLKAYTPIENIRLDWIGSR